MCINCVFASVIIVMCGSVIAAMSIYSLSLELVASIVLGALVFNLSFLACMACMRLLYHRFDECSRRIQLYHQDVCHGICCIVKDNWRLLALMWILRCTSLFQRAEMLNGLELVASIVLGALVFNLSFLAFTAFMRLLFHRFDEWSRRIELYHQDVCHRVCWVVKENWRMLALMWILRCTGLFQRAEILDEIMWGVYGLAQIPNAPVQ